LDTLKLSDMLEYVKTILGKVSFDNELFMRELKKAFIQLSPAEQGQLKHWLRANYQDQYIELLSTSAHQKSIV